MMYKEFSEPYITWLHINCIFLPGKTKSNSNPKAYINRTNCKIEGVQKQQVDQNSRQILRK